MIRARYLLAFGLLVFVGTLVFFAPASLAPRLVQLPSGMTYGALEGTLWNPVVKNVQIQSRPLGDIAVSVSPFSVFTRSASGEVSLTGDGVKGAGSYTVADTLMLENFSFTQGVIVNLGGKPVTSTATVQGEVLAWDKKGQCVSAQASLVTDAIKNALEDIRRDVNDTIADITCQGGKLRVSFSQDLGIGVLSGAGDFDAVNLLNLSLVLRFSDQAAISQIETTFLQELGFTQKQDGWHSEVTMR